MENYDYHPNGKVKLKGHHDNIRMQAAMTELVDNLDNIPIEVLEQFINEHKK